MEQPLIEWYNFTSFHSTMVVGIRPCWKAVKGICIAMIWCLPILNRVVILTEHQSQLSQPVSSKSRSCFRWSELSNKWFVVCDQDESKTIKELAELLKSCLFSHWTTSSPRKTFRGSGAWRNKQLFRSSKTCCVMTPFWCILILPFPLGSPAMHQRLVWEPFSSTGTVTAVSAQLPMLQRPLQAPSGDTVRYRKRHWPSSSPSTSSTSSSMVVLSSWSQTTEVVPGPCVHFENNCFPWIWTACWSCGTASMILTVCIRCLEIVFTGWVCFFFFRHTASRCPNFWQYRHIASL